ncbi:MULTISPECIES: hypothetical protein [unclassified Cryobacterium]|uniref:hypothetical protein n=1 Tax=unclassified Cryobacterium TaxID=2649013 RepID=UPI001068EAA3|nr:MULTISPECIES: hypothetical protein [unclassified Cryobacterium]TFD22133.1 hypothetical protein E3T31_08610 [Cryobacterium sp. TMS1-13-1]TFD56398.1 hypothetical protein E3T41_14395 [Cryobacterium sp. Hh38]
MTTRTPEEEANYWKTHARRHEDRAKANRAALVQARDVLEVVLNSLDDALEPVEHERDTKMIVYRA